jgi:hypothetical protein
MALLSPNPTTDPTGIRTVLPRHYVPGAAVKVASAGFLDAQLTKAGDLRRERA